jgi:DtxR family Mn-dependent transcriptional regulator
MRERHRHGHKITIEKETKSGDLYPLDEFLETLWTLREEGTTTISLIEDKLGRPEARQLMMTMVENRLIQIEGDRFSFTQEGEIKATEIIRRHRLAERLLSDVLEIKGNQMEDGACKFEHILSPEVTDSICTFLGHPRICPHGKPIPKGNCCDKFKRDVQPLIIPLSDLKVGEKGTITFMAPRSLSGLQQLSTLGVIPGTIIRLYQRHPSYVIEMDETTIAIDREIAENIYVRRHG